ncbi:hypothetical protein ACFQKF_10545 [Halalkalicoccus sp. GCM10025322]|uniref:hypothetical protein n=1 Tax=Halalkalicoccus TaxID=332246 RepID=UPI002F9638C6
MSTHSQPTPARPDRTDSPTPTAATTDTSARTDRGPATFDPGCRRRLANLIDIHNEAIPRMRDSDD